MIKIVVKWALILYLCVYVCAPLSLSLSLYIHVKKKKVKSAYVKIIFQMHALMTIYHGRARDKNFIFLPLLLFANAGRSLIWKKFCVLTAERWLQDEWACCIARMKYILRVLGRSIA